MDGFERIDTEPLLSEVKEGYYNPKENIAILELEYYDSIEELLQSIPDRLPAYEYILVFYQQQEAEQFFFYSRQNNVRALEFLDYLISEFGLVKGDGRLARGEVSTAILGVLVAQQERDCVMDYLIQNVTAYFQECDCVEAGSYVSENSDILQSMDIYRKKPVKWAYVRSLDVVKEGQKLRIKSLENESGLILSADEDTYIMVGCRGEIYDITRTKFESTYESTSESLDIFEQMLDFIPVIETIPEEGYISLDEVANICHPKPGNGIYAKPLERRTKVFSERDSQVYFLGRPGDYLAIRRDDVKDIYIIQKEVFAQTYEKA